MKTQIKTHLDDMWLKKDNLHLNKELLSIILYDTDIALWDWNIFSNQIYFSPNCFTMLGYEPYELKHNLSTWEMLVHPDDLKKAKQTITALLEGEGPSSLDLRFKTKDRRWQWTEVRYKISSSCPENRPSHLLGININIHARKQMELELLKSKDAAETAMHVKSEFLANMSHEIRTPLNGILGSLQIIQCTTSNNEKQEFCALAIHAANRLNRLLCNILEQSTLEANHFSIQSSPLILSEFIDQTCELFKPIAQQTQIELTCSVDSKIPRAMNGDATRLQQILTNFLGNAFKFTKTGRISVEAYPLPSSDPNHVRVLFSVTDTGIGIPPDKIKHLFQPFSQVSTGHCRDFQGAGLGLSICKKLVGLMGGSIFIESELNAGTSIHFCITFRVNGVNLDSEANSSISSSIRPHRILLADDEYINRLSTTKLLEKYGYIVTAVSNGKEAISQLQSDFFDLILMDIQMPIMDGIKATEAIRNGYSGQMNKNIPIIAITAAAMAGDREKFLSTGMSDYIPKPVDITMLTEAIERVMAGKLVGA